MFRRCWLVAACVTLSQACDNPPARPAPAPSGSATPAIAPAWEDRARNVSLVEVDAILPPPSDAPALIVGETAITSDGAVIEQLAYEAFRIEDLDDGKPRRVAAHLAKLDRSIDTLHLLVHGAHASRLVFQIMHAAPPTVTRFGLVVRTPRGLASVVVRRKSTPAPTLVIKRSELQTGAQIIAVQPEPQRTAALRTALRELARSTKRLELVVEPTQSYRVLAEVAATAAPLFDEVRAGLVERETPSTVSVSMYPPPELMEQMDQAPYLRCARASLRMLEEIRVTLTFVVGADGSTIEQAKAHGGQLPPVLARCFVDMIRAMRVKVKPGTYEVPIDVRPS